MKRERDLALSAAVKCIAIHKRSTILCGDSGGVTLSFEVFMRLKGKSLTQIDNMTQVCFFGSLKLD